MFHLISKAYLVTPIICIAIHHPYNSNITAHIPLQIPRANVTINETSNTRKKPHA